MSVAILRIIYLIYFSVAALIILRTASEAIFSDSLKNLALAVLVSLFWPLLLFSKEGRKQLARYL